MVKKLAMLAVAVAALIALAIPATASAVEMKHDKGGTQESLQQDVTWQLTGQFHFEGEVGGITCALHVHGHFRFAWPPIKITNFGIDHTNGGTATQLCKVDATLEFLGCTDVASMTVDIGAGNEWTGEALSSTQLSIATKTIQNHLHGGIFCPKTIQLTPGTMNINMSTDKAWTTGQLSGTLQAHTSAGSQNVTVQGHGNLSPSGTYSAA